MASEEVPRHEERPRPGTLVQFALTQRGLAKEEFTSGVKTHSLVVHYSDIWDVCRTQAFPLGLFWRLLAMSAAWAGAAAFIPAGYLLLALSGAAVAAGWVLFILRARTLTVQAFDYDGYELAAFHGLPGPGFAAFLAAFENRVASGRYPLQSVFESLDLGHCAWQGPGRRWRSTFLYDRVAFHTRGTLGHESRVYYSLASIEAPIRLAWRLPWLALTGSAVGLLAALALRQDAGPGGTASPWTWGVAAGSLLLAAWSLISFGVRVEATVGPQAVRSPLLPWWQKSQRREILRWFARIVRLADLLADLETEDYWEYHRNKLGILREEGFLEDWPYRSSLSRLNALEREETGE